MTPKEKTIAALRAAIEAIEANAETGAVSYAVYHPMGVVHDIDGPSRARGHAAARAANDRRCDPVTWSVVVTVEEFRNSLAGVTNTFPCGKKST